MNELIKNILDHPGASVGIIVNLIVIESLLSVDNAAVLASMVMDLPKQQRGRALKFGIWGAYIFRGLAMLFASYLLGFWWLKPLGGLYLLWLVTDQFKSKLGVGARGSIAFKILSLLALLFLIQNDGTINFYALWIFRVLSGVFICFQVYSFLKINVEVDDNGEVSKATNPVYNFFQNKIGIFWSTVVLVEMMDMAFSIDNVFAAVAFTPNIILICIGVFIGILAMRFIAQWFVKLMETYSFLETAAFIVIAVLGTKLLLALYEHYYPKSAFSLWLAGHQADLVITTLTVGIFFFPILSSVFFNFPRKNDQEEHEV